MNGLSKSASGGNVLRVGVVAPVHFHHPWKRIDFVNLIVYRQVFETVFAPHQKIAQVDPLLFSEPLRVEIPMGGKNVYSAAIRTDVRFSDGTLMTVGHVVESLRQNRHFASIADIQPRANRVFFQTNHTSTTLAHRLSNAELAVLKQENDTPIGTGPYVPAADATPERMRLVRNPHYRDPVAIDEIVFQAYPRDDGGRATGLIEAMKAGEVDFTCALYREEVQEIPLVRKSFEIGLSTCLFYFNSERAPLDNPLVRQAMAFALDRNALAKLFYSNYLAYVASGILPSSMDVIADNFGQNLKKARSLVEQSGIDPARRDLVLATICGRRPYLPAPVRVAECIAEQLAALGFRIKIEPTKDLQEYFYRTSRGDYDLLLAGWVPDSPSAADYLDAILSSRRIPGKDQSVMTSVNLARWQNEEMDRALLAYRADTDDRARSTIARLLNEEVPVMALMFGPDIVVHSWRVKNVASDFMDMPLFSGVSLMP